VRPRAPPAVVVQRRGCRPLEVGDERGDEDLRAGGRELRRRADGGVARGAEVGLVDHERDEAAYEPQSVPVELATGARAVERKPALRAELGGGETELCHLREHAIGRELQAPARDLADAPRDRGGREPGLDPARVDTGFHLSLSPPSRAPRIWSALTRRDATSGLWPCQG